MKQLAPRRRRMLYTVFKHKIASLLALMLLASPAAHAVSGGGGSGNASVEDGKTNYFTLEPAFVVNIIDGRTLRFLQVGIDVVSEDSQAIEAVQDHRAPIRHALLMLLAHRDISKVLGLKQRETLRQEALERIQQALQKYADIKSDGTTEDGDGNQYPTGVQDVLFTSFVIQ